MQKRYGLIRQLQTELYKSSIRGELAKVILLQKLIIGSFCGKITAIQHILPKKEYSLSNILKLKLALTLHVTLAQSYVFWKQLSKVENFPPQFIQKMYLRAKAYLIYLALVPQWEAYNEPNFFGNRPNFSLKDAAINVCDIIEKAHFNYMHLGKIKFKNNYLKNKLILDKLNNCEVVYSYISSFLNSLGTPCSLVQTDTSFFAENINTELDYLLINIFLYSIPSTVIQNKILQQLYLHSSISYLIYQDNFCIFCKDTKTLKQIQKNLKKFFLSLGCVYETQSNNFIKVSFQLTYLGFDIFKEKEKLAITPNNSCKKNLLHKIRSNLYKKDSLGRQRALTHLTLEQAIQRINPVLIVWMQHYVICKYSKDLKFLDHIIDNTIYRWQIKKYKKSTLKSWKEQCTKYISSKRVIAQGKETLISVYNYQNYIISTKCYAIKYYRSIYDQDTEYWRSQNKSNPTI